MIDLARVSGGTLNREPFRWAAIDGLYSPADAADLAATYPLDHFKLVRGYGGEKDYEYEARALIAMGSDRIAYEEALSESWKALARDLLSANYRAALSRLTGVDLATAPLEVNVFHYGPGASLGAHSDLPDKVVTHVLYFNESWNAAHGGCLRILREKDPGTVFAEVLPVVGNSAVLVRSDDSWHAVSPVVSSSTNSRRSVTATFYRPGSVSSMWPEDDRTPLRDYGVQKRSIWQRIKARLG